MAEPTPIRSQRARFSAIFALVVGAFGFRWRRFEISDDSMLPTLSDGDWTLGIRSQDLRVGDLVIAAMPDRPDFLIVKRVAATDSTEGSLWLMADNSDGVDSRQFGWVAAQSVRARLIVRYHPWPPRLLR